MGIKRPKLGSHLEWNGSTIRVVVRVPPSLVKTIGSTKLKRSLKTDSPRAAETLKWHVITELKKQITSTQLGDKKGTPDDPLVAEALLWREAIAEDDPEGGPDEVTAKDALFERADRVEAKQGYRDATMLVQVALGNVTPLTSLEDAWLAEMEYAGRTEAARRHALKKFREWLVKEQLAPTIEAVTKKVAGKYVSEAFVQRGTNAATANKAISGLSAYWAWLTKRGHTETNPWSGQFLKERQVVTADGQGKKRPFHDTEVVTLLAGIRKRPLADMCLAAALTGCRINELAELRVRHVNTGSFRVVDGKNQNAARTVPIHPGLASMVASRCARKLPDDYVFHELPEQTDPARKRAAPASQAFTRERRDLKVDDLIPGRRQSRVDFHSWRRWFIRKAVEALESGAVGFTPWTIAEVVGHSKEDGPLGITMGLYPGRADEKALRACVEAVRLPRAAVEADVSDPTEAPPAATPVPAPEATCG